jgi:L-rhamnose mutarotase
MAEEYRRRHAAVWPEMREALHATGWRNYSIFLGSDGHVTGYLECDDFAESVAAMGGLEVNERWQKEMSAFFEGMQDRRPDQAMVPDLEIFHLD